MITEKKKMFGRFKFVIFLGMMSVLSPVSGEDKKTEEGVAVPAFKCVKVLDLDREKFLKEVKKNHQIKISDEDWDNLPRLIRVDLNITPTEGNKGGGGVSFGIYPQRNFTVEFEGKKLACAGAIDTDFDGFENPAKFKAADEGKLTQIANLFADPEKTSQASIVFLVPKEWKTFNLLFDDHIVLKDLPLK